MKYKMITFSIACTKKNLQIILNQMDLVIKLENILKRQEELIKIMKS
jgi:hypothetical protein